MADWKTDFWNPCADIGNCLYGWFIPCGLHGTTEEKIARAQGNDDVSCVKSCLIFWLLHICCLQGCVGCSTRRKIRDRFNLAGDDVNACLIYTVCSCLSVVQDANEYALQADAAVAAQTAAPAQQEMK